MTHGRITTVNMAHAIDTIFAPATAPGRAGVAVIRISGPKAADALAALCPDQPRPTPRMAHLRALYHPASGALIDHALVLYFAAPASFTGENVVELHIHGGRAILQALTQALTALPGLRLAEAGEFTKQAFLNGKMDLTAAEGIADLIDAETEAQRKQALRMVAGELEQAYERYRTRLIRSLALVEAYIDFPDEDIPDHVLDELQEEVGTLREELQAALADDHRGERIADGVHVVILGAPNAGKSTLMNYLAKRDVSIVSTTAGTTRDVVEVHLDINGYPVIIADTAGLRDSEDEIELEGIRRARARTQTADLKLAVFDATAYPDLDQQTRDSIDHNTLIILNKTDQLSVALPDTIEGHTPLAISLKTGDGLDAFMVQLEEKISGLLFSANQPIITRARHRVAMENCVAHLQRFANGGPIELMAEELRIAAHALGSITGRVDVEEVLGEIFRSFCIGK